jgi:hypothetical protein
MVQKESEISGRLSSSENVVAAVDETSTGRAFIIADISRDDSWLSVDERDAVPLKARR